jgi:DNA/RNA-binding domain of Phe-tRNA-synthetase-like protein
MRAKNRVIAGDHLDCLIGLTKLKDSVTVTLTDPRENHYMLIILNKSTVEHYEIASESKGVHTISLQFRDGKRSLLEIDDQIFREFLKTFF